MKTIKFLFLGFALLASTAYTYAFDITATATATIVTPITISKTTDMNFGIVVASGTAGTVVLVPAGTRTATGGASFIVASPGTVTAATFTVTGTETLTYAITLPSTVTLTSGSNTMTAGTFTSTPSATGTIGSGGTQALNVGATLSVGINQAGGTYTTATPFTVTVAYN